MLTYKKLKISNILGISQQHVRGVSQNAGGIKTNDYMSKAARIVINYCLNNNIGTLVLGYNEGLRNNNSSTKNNQNFVMIPFELLRSKIEHLCKSYGIRFVTQEESYTSKASFWDKDEMLVYKPSNNKDN